MHLHSLSGYFSPFPGMLAAPGVMVAHAEEDVQTTLKPCVVLIVTGVEAAKEATLVSEKSTLAPQTEESPQATWSPQAT